MLLDEQGYYIEPLAVIGQGALGTVYKARRFKKNNSNNSVNTNTSHASVELLPLLPSHINDTLPPGMTAAKIITAEEGTTDPSYSSKSAPPPNHDDSEMVAVKEIIFDYQLDELDDTLKEASFMYTLRHHPNIVRFIGSFYHDGNTHYIQDNTAHSESSVGESISSSMDKPSVARVSSPLVRPSFSSKPAMCLVEELVDGLSLFDLTETKRKALASQQSSSKTKKSNPKMTDTTSQRGVTEATPFNVTQVATITADILHALYYLHTEVRIVHRDVKCSNILLCARTNTAKLCDFGTCGAIDNPNVSRHTMIGTPGWLAPEVLEGMTMAVRHGSNTGSRRFNPMHSAIHQEKGTGHGFVSDIWSLGITILEMVLMKPRNSMFGGDKPAPGTKTPSTSADILAAGTEEDITRQRRQEQFFVSAVKHFSQMGCTAKPSASAVSKGGNTTAGVTHPVYGRGNEDFGVAVVSSVQPSPIASPFNLTPATNNKGSISTPTSQAAQQALLGAPFLQDFIACCLRRNPTERWTAEVLLKHHPFMSTIDNGTALFERNRGRGRRSDEIGRDSVIRDLVNEAFAFCPQLNLHRDIRQGEQSVGQSGTHVSTKQSPGDLSSTPLHDTAPHFPTPVSKNRKKGYNFSNLDGLGKVFIESKAMMGPYPVVSDTQSVHYKSEHNRNLEKSAHVCVEAGRVDEKSDLNNGDKVHGNHNKPKSGGDGSKEQQCYVSSKMGTSTCGNLEPTTKAPHDTMNKRDECHNGYSSASREVLSTILLPAAKAAPNTARRIAALFAPLIEGQTDGRKADMQYKLGVQSVVESSKDEGCDSHGHANTRDALLSLATHGGATLTTETTAVNGNNSDLFVSPVSSFRANLERKHKESVNLMERQIELLYKLEAKHHGFAAEFVSRFVSSLIGQPQHQKQDAAGEGRAKGADNSATEETAMCQSINADDKQHIKSAAKGYDPIVRHIFDLTAMLCTDPNDPSNALSSVSQALREAEVPKVPPNCKRMSTDTEACDITGGNKRDSIDETVKSAQFPQSKRGEQQPLLLIREPPKWSNISLYQRRWELDFHSRGANADAAAVVPPPVIPFYGESSALPPPRMPSSSSFPNHHRDKEYVDATSLLYNSWMEESYRHISSL